MGWFTVQSLPWLGMLVLAVCNVGNVIGTWAGRWTSSPITWGIWAGINWIAFGAQLTLGGGWAAVLLFPFAAIGTVVAGGAVWRRWKDGPAPDQVSWQRHINLICGVSAGVALICLMLVVLAGLSGAVPLVLALATDLVAGVPTFVIAWRTPTRVPIAAFAGAVVSAVLTLAAAEWTVWQVIYPAYLAVFGVLMIGVITGRRLVTARPVVQEASHGHR